MSDTPRLRRLAKKERERLEFEVRRARRATAQKYTTQIPIIEALMAEVFHTAPPRSAGLEDGVTYVR